MCDSEGAIVYTYILAELSVAFVWGDMQRALGGRGAECVMEVLSVK